MVSCAPTNPTRPEPTGNSFNHALQRARQHAGFAALVALLLALLLLSPGIQADTLTASVDRDKIALDETLTLTLRHDSRSISGQPDLSVLEPFFDILGTGQSRQLRSINGRTESFTQWQYSLAPKMTGRIQIPAIELHGARSQPLQVEVSEPQVSPTAPGGDYFLERELQPQRLSVGQQLLVRVRLNTAVRLSEMQITPLAVEGAKLIELEDRQYQRTLNGRPYRVYEKNYALFPETPGPLTLPAQRVSAVKGGSRSLFDLNRGQSVRLSTEAQPLTVAPPPVDAATEWLPADSLRIEQRLESGGGPLYAGEPVTLTLRLDTEGADPARLPVLSPPPLSGVKVYPEPAQDQQSGDANGVRLQRSQRFALVPTQPGTLTLPATTLRWWNAVDGEFSEARTRPLTLEVLPARQRSTASPAPAAEPLAPVTPQVPPTTAAVNDPEPTAPPPGSPWLLWSNLLWAALCTLLALAWWRTRRRSANPVTPPPARAPAASSVAVDQQLEKACQQGDPQVIRRAILAWARSHALTGDQPPSLERIAARADEPLKAQLAALDRALFAPDREITIDGKQLLTGLKSLRNGADRAPREAALAELYPQ